MKTTNMDEMMEFQTFYSGEDSIIGTEQSESPMSVITPTQTQEQTAEQMRAIIEQVDALNVSAWLLRNTDTELAFSQAQEAFALSHGINYEIGIAYSSVVLGMRASFYSNAEAAMEYANEALRIFEQRKDVGGIGRVYFLLGFVYWGLGDYEEGLEYALKSLDMARSVNDRQAESWGLYSLGTFYFDLNDYPQSLGYYQQSLDILQNLIVEGVDISFAKARTLNGIGSVCIRLGEYQKAHDYLFQSLEINERTGNGASTARTLQDIGTVYQELGDPERALQYYNESLVIRERIGHKQGLTTTLLDLGNLFAKQNIPDIALEYLNRALALAEEINAKPKIFRIHQAFAEVYEQVNNPARALWHFKAFHRIKEQVTGDEQNMQFKNLRASFQAEKSQKEAEIVRLRNVELAQANTQLAEAYGLVEQERSESEKLLLNVLPKSIAQRLKTGERPIAENFIEATVLFADIVGFTQLSAQNSPEEIVTMLDWVFSIFDGLTEHFGLEKIKTIGDAYMVASGIPVARADHVEAAATMALAIVQEIRDFASQSGVPMEVRVGIHTGSVVAGVIGKQKFIYDLWGDTVNTASRMESHGEAGKIHVTEEVYQRLTLVNGRSSLGVRVTGEHPPMTNQPMTNNQFTFEERGEIEIKGKGMMRTWFLTAVSP